MKLHDYQEVAVAFLRGRDRAGLFLDMGLGKTLSCLAALEPRHFPVAVIAPKKVAESVWAAEAAKWGFDYDIAVAMGGPAERAREISRGAPITVISRDNQGDLLTVKHRPYRTLIIDELSGYKGRGVRYKQARRLIAADSIIHVWGLTGTPSPNGYLDLWPQIALLDQGHRLGKNITAYRDRYFLPGRQLPSGVIVDWVMRPESEANINRAIEDITLSMKSEGRISLPPTTVNVVDVELPVKSKQAYKDLAKNLIADLRDVLGPDAVHTAAGAAQLSNRLSQITAGFMYEDVDTWQMSGRQDQKVTWLNTAKLDALKEILDVATSPVLVFYRYKPELQMLYDAFPDLTHVNDPGAIERWNAGKVPLMVAHPASAAHGLNLQDGGHTAVWTTLPWSLEEWEQANKRLARQGQRSPVVIHVLAVPGSVDHLILARLGGKSDVQRALMDHLESPL